MRIYNFVITAYRGCFSESHFLSKSIAPDYESIEFMKIGFCIQVCIGKSLDPQNSPKFIGVSVSLIYNPKLKIKNRTILLNNCIKKIYVML